MSECNLTISKPNAKIPHWNFNLPAGFTCPFADKCLSKADRQTGKIKDAEDIDFRCFAASTESSFPSVRKSRWNNFEALKTIGIGNVEGMKKAIVASIENQLPRSEKVFRIHVGGDFFNKSYLDAWIEIAKHYPDITFYTYSKSIPYFLGTNLPKNLIVTFSKGGKNDELIDKLGLKFSVVVNSEDEAKNYVWYDKEGQKHTGLEIDHDDSHAWKNDKPFALLLHGIQPKGSKAAEALKKLGGVGGKSSYGTKSKEDKKVPLKVLENFDFKNWLFFNF